MPSAVSCSLSEIVIPESAPFTPATSASDVCLFACLLNLSITYDLNIAKQHRRYYAWAPGPT